MKFNEVILNRTKYIVGYGIEAGRKHISVSISNKRKFKEARNISWDVLNTIKESIYPDSTMVEFYPTKEEVVNLANVRHLWEIEIEGEEK
jgi:hypothetical protein